MEQKRTWSIRHDGYPFAAGYYEPWGPDPATLPVVSKEDPDTFTQAIVLGAIARYEFAGIEATAIYYNDPANIDGQWYVSITDENDLFVAHAPMPALVGTDLKAVMGLDGSPLDAEIAKKRPEQVSGSNICGPIPKRGWMNRNACGQSNTIATSSDLDTINQPSRLLHQRRIKWNCDRCGSIKIQNLMGSCAMLIV